MSTDDVLVSPFASSAATASDIPNWVSKAVSAEEAKVMQRQEEPTIQRGSISNSRKSFDYMMHPSTLPVVTMICVP